MDLSPLQEDLFRIAGLVCIPLAISAWIVGMFRIVHAERPELTRRTELWRWGWFATATVFLFAAMIVLASLGSTPITVWAIVGCASISAAIVVSPLIVGEPPQRRKA